MLTGKSAPLELVDTDEKKYAYKVEASGSLTILEAGADLKWFVSTERSASGYVEVRGTRYLPDTSKLEGSSGKAEFTKKVTAPVFVL